MQIDFLILLKVQRRLAGDFGTELKQAVRSDIAKSMDLN